MHTHSLYRKVNARETINDSTLCPFKKKQVGFEIFLTEPKVGRTKRIKCVAKYSSTKKGVKIAYFTILFTLVSQNYSSGQLAAIPCILEAVFDVEKVRKAAAAKIRNANKRSVRGAERRDQARVGKAENQSLSWETVV